MESDRPDFDLMFRSGVVYRWKDGRDVVTDVRDAGKLNLATGRLVAGDPFLGPDLERLVAPFTATVMPGHYRVMVSMGRWDKTKNSRFPAPRRRGAGAKVIILNEPVEEWELGVHPGEDVSILGPEENFGFSVDAGVGSFFDASAIGAVSNIGEPGTRQHNKIIYTIGEECVMNLTVDAASKLNAILFNCGGGDGFYSVWVGRTAAGQPACFAVDLQLFSRSLGIVSD